MMERPSPDSSRQLESLQPFLQLLGDESGASGIALLRLDGGEAMLEATESHPSGLGGRRFPMQDRFPQMADRGIIASTDLMLPTHVTRWLGGRPQHLVLHTLHFPDFDGYLLFCWLQERPADAMVARVIKGAVAILPALIDRHALITENQRLGNRLNAILNNVTLGIAISDASGRSQINPIAATLLGLKQGMGDAADLAAAMRHLRNICEIKTAIDLDVTGAADDAEYWMLPAGTTGGRRVIRSESHAIGDTLNPGRIWLFTDVTLLWESGQRLKQLNAALQEREAELRRYAEDLEISRASIEEQAQQAVELAEELHLQKQELENSKRESDYLANHDPLTGLNNRRAFRHALQQMIDVARGTKGQVAILFIDLDKFKAVNDTLGHDAGDQLLKRVAQVLNEALRDTDLLARFGGDEFAIATRIPGSADLAKITGLAERIRQKLEIPVPAPVADNPAATIDVCGTIGISIYPSDAADIDALFICADQAMYAGKKAGRNRVVMFSALMPK
jgi:diguanylate cyclase (GGDEF)-like protein